MHNENDSSKNPAVSAAKYQEAIDRAFLWLSTGHRTEADKIEYLRALADEQTAFRVVAVLQGDPSTVSESLFADVTPASTHPQTLDALRSALTHAEKHAARCDVGAFEALNAWTDAESAVAHGGRVMKDDVIVTVTPGRVAQLWCLYSGERDNATRAHAAVAELQKKLRASRGEVSEVGAAERACAVLLSPLQLTRLLEVVGERCDRLHTSKAAIVACTGGSDAARLSGVSGALTFWTAIEVAIRNAQPAP